MGSAKGFWPGFEDGLSGAKGWFCVFAFEFGGSANGSAIACGWDWEEKSRPRVPRLGNDWLSEALRRSAWSCISRSSMPRSCEKLGGPLMLACFSVMLRAEAKGSIDWRSFRRRRHLKLTFSVKRSHQSLKRSLTVRCPVWFERTDELFLLCCGIGPSRNCEFPRFRLTLGVSLRSPDTFDFREPAIPTTPAFNVSAASRNFSV